MNDITPLPWITDLNHFTQHCTRCGHCIDVCENQIIVKGDGGFPRLDFHIDECTFCYRCAKACPESLFAPQSSVPWHMKATIEKTCLAKQNVECQRCQEQCEPMAIEFKRQIGHVAQPNVRLDACTGCGACVAVCPTSSIAIQQSDE